MTRELDDPDFERLLAFRSGLRRFLHWSEGQAAAAGLTATQHQLLLAVRGHPGRHPTIRDVADHLLIRHHSAVELVDRAAAAGFVRRVTDPIDHRVVHVALTAAGNRKLQGLSALHLEELRRMAPRIRSLWTGLDPI